MYETIHIYGNHIILYWCGCQTSVEPNKRTLMLCDNYLDDNSSASGLIISMREGTSVNKSKA